VLSIEWMQMMWLKIDVGLPRVLQRRTALPTPRAPDGCVDGVVPTRVDAHVEDYRLSIIPYLMGHFVIQPSLRNVLTHDWPVTEKTKWHYRTVYTCYKTQAIELNATTLETLKE
jgi:hypothetical protein